MGYAEYTLEDLRRVFGLKIRDQPLFERIGTLEPSAWLVETLAKGQDLAVTSEKARGEFIVAPVLMACRALLGHDLRIFSGARLDIDPERGLKGECDFILARSESSLVFQAPLMVILEAKKNDFEVGLGQCAAQLLGARLYNEKEGRAVASVYGCVTTGTAWQFLKLTGNDLLIHPEQLPIQELDKILWFLVECLRDVDREAAAIAAA
jgi:hypothetical protein